MANVKEYQIKINGVQESIDAVETLNKQLNALESRIKQLESANVKVGTTTSTARASSTSTLSQDVALQKELNSLKNEGTKLEAKQVAYQDESYQKVLAQKDVLKEIVNDQKTIAAQERLQADTYSNTMQGMKDKLADLKAVINTTDLGDSESIKNMTKEANELTTKLKEMEEAYGQFGRNVGNYESAADGFTKFKIQVGDVTREFTSAREASRQLKQELLSLEDGAEGAQELRVAIQQVDSAIKDLNKSSQTMDNLLDTMEGIVAVANVGQGIRGLFGVDDAEMQKSIKNLVALQNILKGIETINKQINTGEGIIGALIKPFNTQIDVATTKLLKFNTSLLGTSKAAKVAAVSIKAFGKALKLALSAGILIVLDLVTEGVLKLIDSLKKGSEEAERTKKITEETSKAYGDAAAKISYYQTKVNSFNGTKRQEKRLVEELNSALGSQLGSYKTLAQWKDVLIKKGALYAQVLAKEAKVQALSAAQAEAMAKVEKAIIERNGVERYKQERVVEGLQSKLEKAIADLVKFQQDNKLGDFSDSIEKNTNKSADALKKEQEILSNLELAMMKDSLAKVLRQMEINHEAEVKELGKNKKAIQASEKLYYANRQKAIEDFFKNVNSIIAANQEKNKEAEIDFNLKDTSAQIDELILKFNELNEARAKVSHLSTKDEFNEQLTKTSKENILYASEFNYLATKDQGEEYHAFLNDFLAKQKQTVQEYIKANSDSIEDYYKRIEAFYRNAYANELSLLEEFKGDEKEVLKRYNHQTEEDLESSLTRKLQREEEFSNEVRNELEKNILQRRELLKEEATHEEELALNAELNDYKALQKPLQAQKDALEQSLQDIKVITDDDKKLYEDLKTSLAKVEQEILQNEINHSNNMARIAEERGRKISGITMNSAEEMSTLYEGYYRNNLEAFSSTYNKVRNMMSETPVNSFDIVNIVKLSKNLKEAEKTTKTAITRIKSQMVSLDINLAMGLIKPEVAQKTKAELEEIEQMFKKMFGEIQEEQSNAIPKFVQSLTPYIQSAMDSFSTIINAVWNAQDVAFDKEQEEIDKYNEKLQDAMDKQEQIVQDHKDAIDSIEDELETARGDRRQELIDRLNAEVKAEKIAAREKEKIAKEEERMKIKQDELDKRRKEAEYNRQIIQAAVNGAMAITMAAINKWPVPAIPMIALAATTTAAQIAIMKANKPYAKGGLLSGPSHSQGGMPILGSDIVVEGSEYVVNKKTTTENVEVLDYINSKKKRLSLDDFIDFYGKKSNVSRVVQSASPRTHFESGGILPSIDYNFESTNDRLLSAFEKYATKPSYVSVVDIIDKTDQLTEVQALAGLGQD